jgi:hypothetical protein
MRHDLNTHAYFYNLKGECADIAAKFGWRVLLFKWPSQ